ncbi:MAG: hypothetical protein Q8Q31_02805 [Nanoarchaeota archaeon]|nr:hypothetical protein [Nanoarchaeota archaeon]
MLHIMMKYLNLKIMGAFLFFILASHIASAENVSKSDIRPILKKELANYFEGKTTLLSENEIRALLDVYTKTSGNSINIDSANVSEKTKELILSSLRRPEQQGDGPVDTINTRADPVSLEGKKYGERCDRGKDYQCQTGKCMKLNPFLPFYQCGYIQQESLLGTNKRCDQDGQCASGKCRKKCYPLVGCPPKKYCK